MSQIINLIDRKQLPVIKKSELADGSWYIGKTNQRGMPIGQWDGIKQKFLCIKPPKFGMSSLYEMNHLEDDDGFVCFEPVIIIEL